LVLILHETEKMNALVIDERIRKKVKEAVLKFEGKTLKVTLSGGIAPYSGDGKGAQDLVHAADVALYQAKDRG
jgi:diguanylate cyclase